MKPKPVPFCLHYAASEHDADQLYATGFFAPDPFLWWQEGGKSFAVFNPLEVDRAKKQATVDKVWAIEDFLGPKDPKGAVALITAVARKRGFRSFEVPAQFPAGLMEGLRAKGLKVKPVMGAFFPERMIKTDDEIAALRKGVALASVGMFRGFEVLREAKIRKDRKLIWGGLVLTSERLRGEIDAAIIREGGLPAHTIVAGGEQGCDPHERGQGPLRANELLILDIFPRDATSGYFGDLTRTVVKGKASVAQQKLWATVQAGKRWVMRQVKPGVSGKKLHEALVKRFADQGYPTQKQKGRWTGFFHGTGHGLGLEIHEAPRFGEATFEPGHVVTVEPGLYYPGIGGVRIEDVIVVTKTGFRNLTRVPEFLEIR